MMRYKFEIWDSETMLTDSPYDFETEEEAMEEGLAEISSRIEEWKSEGCWDGETVEDYDIRVKEDDSNSDSEDENKSTDELLEELALERGWF